MNFEINIEQIQNEIKVLDNVDIVKKYKLRCCSGRTAPMGIDENGDYFCNGQYIKIIVNEMKIRNLQNDLLKWDI